MAVMVSEVLVVHGDQTERDLIVGVLSEVLDRPADKIVKCATVKRASEIYGLAAYKFDLIVIDIHITGRAVGDGGYLFVEDYVLKTERLTPAIIFVSRFGEFRDDRRKKIEVVLAGRKIGQLQISEFTPERLDKVLRQFGISSHLKWPTLFGDNSWPQNKEHVLRRVQSGCEPHLNVINGTRDEIDRKDRARSFLEWIDQSMASSPEARKCILSNSETVRYLTEQCRKLADVIGMQSDREQAWVKVLLGDLLWRQSPEESLYNIMKTIELNLQTGDEPLGVPGDPVYAVAQRLYRDMCPVSSALSWTRASAYQENIWRQVIRKQVKCTIPRLKQYPKALLDIERRLVELSTKLEDRGRSRAAHEFEARSCQVRKSRLGLFDKSVYLILQKSCDYGNSPTQLFMWCGVIVSLFAVLYFPTPPWLQFRHGWLNVVQENFTISYANWPYESPNVAGSLLHNMVTAVYFSVVTFVTLGYGDITPHNTFGKVLAMTEAALGFTIFGLFIAIASNRLRPR